jgi:hypothetical protein
MKLVKNPAYDAALYEQTHILLDKGDPIPDHISQCKVVPIQYPRRGNTLNASHTDVIDPIEPLIWVDE